MTTNRDSEFDWTKASGRSNSSPAFHQICKTIENLIRSDAHTLISGGADRTARLVAAQLAHNHGMEPRDSGRLSLIAWALQSVICCENSDFTLYDRLLDIGFPIDWLLEDVPPLSSPPFLPDELKVLLDLRSARRTDV